MKCRLEKVPNLLSATVIAHRSAAQYGQYSAPMYSISGFPCEVSGGAPVTGNMVVAVPLPTEFSVLAGTLVICFSAVATLFAAATDECRNELITMNATTTTSTATTLPAVSRTCLRTWARRAAACCAAIFSRALSRRFRSALPILVLPYR